MVPPDDEPDGSRTQTSYSRESDPRWAHRDLGGWWWLAALAAPLLLAALLLGVRGGGIESDLADASRTALAGAGLADVAVSLDGRDATVGPTVGADLPADDLERARGLVAEVPGVRAAAIDAVGVADGGSAGMLRLFGQLWLLLLLSFLVGALGTWLVAKVALPHEEALEAEVGTSAGGLFS